MTHPIFHHYAQAAATHQIIQSNLAHRRGAEALLLLLGPHPRSLGYLGEGLLTRLGALSTERMVVLSPGTLLHILDRRGQVSKVHAETIIASLEQALANPRYLQPPRKNGTFNVVGHVPTKGIYILLVLKFVPAVRSGSKRDEWWVETARQFGHNRIRPGLARGTLMSL